MRCGKVTQASSRAIAGPGRRGPGIRESEIANALRPQFPREGEHDRTDDQPHQAKHLEAAEAAHENPGERQTGPVARDRGPHDLVAAEQDDTTQPNEITAAVAAPVIASCNVNATTAT